jgi:hypothetical protein
VNFDFFLKRDTLLDKEFVNVASVVALQLDYGAPLRVFVGCAVAAPSFLKELQYFLKVQVLWKTLHKRQTFSCSSLLEV